MRYAGGSLARPRGGDGCRPGVTPHDGASRDGGSIPPASIRKEIEMNLCECIEPRCERCGRHFDEPAPRQSSEELRAEIARLTKEIEVKAAEVAKLQTEVREGQG